MFTFTVEKTHSQNGKTRELELGFIKMYFRLQKSLDSSKKTNEHFKTRKNVNKDQNTIMTRTQYK